MSSVAQRTAIVTVTLNPALDVWATTQRVEPDRKLHCTDAELTPGGGGINVSRAIQRLGGGSSALFPTGGSSGELLCDLLRHEGLDLWPVPTSGMTRESFAIRERSTGRHFRFVLPGPTLTAGDFDACRAELERLVTEPALVVFSGSLPLGLTPEQLTELIALVHGRHSEVVVDTSGPSLSAVARAGVALLKPSVNELGQHHGRPLTDVADIETAARRLLDSGPNGAVLVSLGAAGALLVAASTPTTHLVAPLVKVISTVGAGDSLVAAMVLALARGEDLVDAARLGVAAGTAATLAADHSLCHAEDVARLVPQVRILDGVMAARGTDAGQRPLLRAGDGAGRSLDDGV
jgi:6-phosphofructokinase 2